MTLSAIHRTDRSAPWLVAVALSAALFAADLAGVESGATALQDRSLDLSLHDIFGPATYHFFEVVSTLGGGTVRVALVTVLVLALVVTRSWWSSALTIAATGGAALLETLSKVVVGRPRPHLFPHAVPADGSNFPSGHAANACAFALVTIYLLWHVSPRRGLTVLGATILVAFTLLVGLSRLILGVHYPTDILGGYALAGAWVSLLLALFAPALREEAMRAFLRRSDRLDS